MKKSIMILMVMAGFHSSGQSSTDSVYVGINPVKANVAVNSEDRESTKAPLAIAIETGSIYNATSPYHNVLHEFTYLVAMRDYCNKALLQMPAIGKVNKERSKKLEGELSKAKAGLASAKFNGLRIEPDLYVLFLKQINDRFWN